MTIVPILGIQLNTALPLGEAQIGIRLINHGVISETDVELSGRIKTGS